MLNHYPKSLKNVQIKCYGKYKRAQKFKRVLTHFLCCVLFSDSCIVTYRALLYVYRQMHGYPKEKSLAQTSDFTGFCYAK